jgi:hypothetical protein
LLATRAVAVTAIVFIVLISIEARFALWTTDILSESLGITLGLVAITAWWRASAEPTERRLTWAWVWTIAFVLERDSHTIPVLVVVVPAAAAVALLAKRISPEIRRRLLVGAVAAVLACGYVYVAQKVSGRDRYAVENNFGVRVLPDPALRAWFVKGGMPLDAALLGRTGKNAFDDNRQFDTDPALARFRNWADGPGSRRFLESLVFRSSDWYRMLDMQWNTILSDNYGAYDGYGVSHRLPQRYPAQLGGPQTKSGLAVWLVVAAGALVAAVVVSGWSGSILFAGAGLVAVLLELYTSFAGDALEVDRHVAGALNRLDVIVVLAVAISADALWRHRRSGRAKEATSPEQVEDSPQLTLDMTPGG